jgi:cell division protein FtsW (lipid II flippase)
MITCWMVVNILELANPESRSFLAWFYAMRGVALYFFLTLLIAYLCLERKKDMNWFLTIWFLFSILGTLWGLKQLYWGLDNGEKNWLNIPGNLSTHVLFGRLRVFSFYSDAGQFGASQAHTALVAILLFLQPAAGKRKWFYLITAVACFYGMLISGTRGAFAIPLVGGLTYLILMKNFKVFLTGISLIGIVFFLLKFTFIGQSNYQIQRLRSSLNPQDASLQVRIINQKKLANYLDGHWFGGGVGSGGYWGQRFSPNTFLANLALDSWYVRIAAEYGYIGLLFYLAMLIFIVYRAYRGLQEEPDPVVKYRLIAIFCGLLGILVASYGNQVFGQMPTSILIYLSIVFLTAPAHSTQRIHEKSLP